MPTMEEGREHAVQAIHEALSSLKTLGLTARLAYGTYSGCAEPTILGHLGWRNDAGGWRYTTKGRMDLPEGQFGSASLARQVRDALAADGWKPATGFLGSVEGIQEAKGGDRWTVHADRSDLSISVDCYTDRPYVLVDIYGPCLPTTREQEKEYVRAGTDEFDVDGGGEP